MLKLFRASAVLVTCTALFSGALNPALAHGEKKSSRAMVVQEQTDWGAAGDAAKVVRTIDVSMGDDMRFKPGKTGEIVWMFNKVGEFEFACLMAGHFQAGMVGTITVTAQ